MPATQHCPGPARSLRHMRGIISPLHKCSQAKGLFWGFKEFGGTKTFWVKPEQKDEAINGAHEIMTRHRLPCDCAHMSVKAAAPVQRMTAINSPRSEQKGCKVQQWTGDCLAKSLKSAQSGLFHYAKAGREGGEGAGCWHFSPQPDSHTCVARRRGDDHPSMSDGWEEDVEKSVPFRSLMTLIRSGPLDLGPIRERSCFSLSSTCFSLICQNHPTSDSKSAPSILLFQW